jgi:hypothetical protein
MKKQSQKTCLFGASRSADYGGGELSAPIICAVDQMFCSWGRTFSFCPLPVDLYAQSLLCTRMAKNRRETVCWKKGFDVPR